MRFIKIERRTAFILTMIVSISMTTLSPNSSARTVLLKSPGAIAADDQTPPTQPGTNGKIVFTSTRDGNSEIYVMNADGSNQVNLTKNPATDATPVWSPDGSRIAFTSNRSGRTNLYVMNADGSNVTKITHNDDGVDFRIYDPAWSPDGSKLVYVGSFMGELSSLLVVNADGSGTATRVDGGATEVADPEWSPDGTRIAFTGREACSDCYPSAPLISFNLFVVNADGSGKTLVAVYAHPFSSFFPDEGSGPTWSPDGASIAYSYDNRLSPAQMPTRIGDIAVVNASGGGFKYLTETSADDIYPSWSPDGSRIAFTSDRDGHREIYVMNADGSNQTRLTSGTADNFDPNWQTVNRTAPPPAQSTMQFRSANFSVKERSYTDPTKDLLTVTRLGDLSHESSVDYATSDTAGLAPCDQTNTGVASSRCDYNATYGTLHFAPGEASKTIRVPIVDDSYVEPAENFFVTLSNPMGGVLGGIQKAVVSIVDNDSPAPDSHAPPNPIDGNSFFIYQHYFDFLSREPESGGYNGWLGIMNKCPASGKDAQGNFCDRIEVSADFFRSPEFQSRGYFIYRFYSAAFGRNPSYSEFVQDQRRVSGFQTDTELEASKVAFVNDFVSRPEFRQKYDAITDPAAFVDAILSTAGVAMSQKQQLSGDLSAGKKSRAEILRAIVESTEVYNKYYNTAFVVMQYFGYLRRDPDILYLDWIKIMDRTGDYRTMINGFMNSVEYRQRFGP